MHYPAGNRGAGARKMQAAGYWRAPFMPLTEKLRRKFLDSKAIEQNGARSAWKFRDGHIRETLPETLVSKYRLVSKGMMHYGISHLPQSHQWLHQAQRRLKFEELFYNQFRLIKNKLLHETEYGNGVR